jgi:hypothetical protein
MATQFDNNSYVQNGQLYIMPTLTSAALGENTVQSGTYTMDPCTESCVPLLITLFSRQ